MTNEQLFLNAFKENLEKSLKSNKDNILDTLDTSFQDVMGNDFLIVNNDEGTASEGFLNYSIANYKLII